MDGKSVKLVILWWSEMIISLRVLLFSIPVFINKYLAKSFSLADINDRFIAVISVTALLYFGVGLISIIGSKNWKVFQYSAAFIVLALTAYSLYTFDQPPGSVGLYYFYPVLLADMLALLTLVLGRNKRTA